MSVSTYNPNQCQYRLDKLEKVVYLISANAAKNIIIDNGEAFISGLTETPMKLNAYNISLADTDEFDERYKFTHTLTFSLVGYANYTDFQGKYFVIVKSLDGEYWLVNPMFPCKVTYTYTLGHNESHTDFTMATISNHPTLRVKGLNWSKEYECGYKLCGIDKLSLNERAYSYRSANHVVYTNDGFKDVVFDKKSGTFTESFDGDTVKHQLKFDIKFDDYKSSWHYNLLEFEDNKYSAIIKTTCNNYLLCGFHFGLQPSYAVEANDETTPDKIQIELNDMHDTNGFLSYSDSVTVIKNGNREYVYTTKYGGSECVGNGIARYLLKEQIDAFGNPTGNYQCLEGYTSRFTSQGLNIVGTFNDTETFVDWSCEVHCYLNTNIPNNINFTSTTCNEYTLQADSDWSISSTSNYVYATPSSGVSGTQYTVRVCNTYNPTSSALTGTLNILYCNKSKSVGFKVMKQSSCFGQGNEYNISANAQTLTIPTYCCVSGVTEPTSTIYNISIQSDAIQLYVPQNDTKALRTFTLNVTFCDNSTAQIIINQQVGFEKWVKEGTECVGTQKCDIERKYTGTTAYDINTRTDETRHTNCVSSQECGEVQTDWINTTQTTCSEGKKYIVQAERISYDGGTTWQLTGNKRLGAVTSDSPAECSGTPTYQDWRTEGYMCQDTTKYQAERLYTSTDNVNWTATNTYRRTATVLATDSTDCGYDPNVHYDYYQWRGSGTSCNGFDKYTLYYKWVSNDAQHWTATTITKLDVPMTGNSTDCGYVPPISYEYRWILTSATTCVGYDEYYQYKKQRSVSGTDVWEDVVPTTYSYNGDGTQTPQLKKQNSETCGYVPPTSYITKYVLTTSDYVCDECGLTQYRWVDIPLTTDYYCVGYDKVYKQKRQQSTDGQTWTDVSPAEYQMGITAETNSTDCGYSPTPPSPTPTIQYRWHDLNPSQEYYCSGTTKMYKQIYQQSTDSGVTWTDVSPAQYRMGSAYQSNSTDCGYVPPVTPTGTSEYLTIRASGSSTISFSNTNLSASTDGGVTWSQFTSPINLSNGDLLQLKGTEYPSIGTGIGSFSASTGSFSVEGNAMSLLFGDNFENQKSLADRDYAFWALFFHCSALKSIEDLILPATTLSNNCYEYMFKSCGNLERVKIDLLPAMTMKPYCYHGMFDGCQLQWHLSPPDLSATTLASHCYDSMFKNSDIRVIGSLPATTLAEYCYKDMFAGVKRLISPPDPLMARTLVEGCYEGMFSGCTNLQGMYCLAVNGINENNSTTDWLSGVASSGTFTKTTNVTWPSGSSGIPEGWTVQNSEL